VCSVLLKEIGDHNNRCNKTIDNRVKALCQRFVDSNEMVDKFLNNIGICLRKRNRK